MMHIKSSLKVVESDIIKIKRKIKGFQNSGDYHQIGWRKKVLTKLQKKASMIYSVLTEYNKLRKEWQNLK